MNPRRPTATRKDFGAERRHLRALAWHARELIGELDRMHPATTPNLDTPERELWANIGARKVVEMLLALRAEAEQEAGGAFATSLTSTILPTAFSGRSATSQGTTTP